jgi:pyruvate/2-oxoglutarate dehydrogenase complex dihydrolipoamide acyltransferase (E2) component
VAIVDILIPQMGEGLREVCIVGFQKQPGDFVRRDEPLYTMETDKAAMEVESPHEGVLTEWLAQEGAILAVGAPVGRIEVEEEAEAEVQAGDPTPIETPAAQTIRDGSIPPRTRAYCREKGLSDEEIRRIPAATGKLMPADVDAYLATKDAGGTQGATPEYTDRSLSPQHRTMIFRLRRSAQLVIPAVAKRPMAWSAIRHFADACRDRGDAALQPSAFQTFAFCVAQAVRGHPRFRSTLVREEAVREYAHVNLGIAVGLPDGQLTTAVVKDADTLDFPGFVRAAQERIQQAREGVDQADESTQLLLTYLGPYEITDAIPVLIAPAAAVLFLGSPFLRNGESLVNLVLTFDHRLIQGVEAAEFLRTVVETARRIDQWPREFTPSPTGQ